MFFLTTAATLATAPRFTFDVLFFWSFGYTVASWMSLTPQERGDFRHAVDVALQEPAT